MFMPLKQDGSKPGEECTNTSLISRDALGNLFRKDSLTDSKSYFVRRFLLRDLRMIAATLSWTNNDEVKRTIVIINIIEATILLILNTNLISPVEFPFARLITGDKGSLFESIHDDFLSRKSRLSSVVASKGDEPK